MIAKNKLYDVMCLIEDWIITWVLGIFSLWSFFFHWCRKSVCNIMHVKEWCFYISSWFIIIIFYILILIILLLEQIFYFLNCLAEIFLQAGGWLSILITDPVCPFDIQIVNFCHLSLTNTIIPHSILFLNSRSGCWL